MAVRVISAPPGHGKTLNMTRFAIKITKDLNRVYGIVYIIECIAFFGMLLSPFIIIFRTAKRRRL